MTEPSEKEPVSLRTSRGGLHHVTRGQPTNQPGSAEQAAVPKAPTGSPAPSKHADFESAAVEAAKPSKAAAVQPDSSQSPQDPSSSASSPKIKSIAQRRLSEELADLARDPPPGCSAHLANRGYPFKWRAVIGGPKDTPFEGGTFGVDITFPRDYPNSPFKVKFTTKIYHPNVSEHGDIGLDILRSKWSPAVTVEFVLVAIVDLMKTPDMNCVLHQKAAQHYKSDYQLYDTIAREWTQTYARPHVEDPGVWPPVGASTTKELQDQSPQRSIQKDKDQ
nr:ubiquitin-conjugating enzyme E2 D4-like [Rhipicephalus microplus]